MPCKVKENQTYLLVINKAMMDTALNNGALRQKLNYFLSAFSSTVSALSDIDKVSERKKHILFCLPAFKKKK
jgi:hypothetical protein